MVWPTLHRRSVRDANHLLVPGSQKEIQIGFFSLFMQDVIAPGLFYLSFKREVEVQNLKTCFFTQEVIAHDQLLQQLSRSKLELLTRESKARREAEEARSTQVCMRVCVRMCV